MPYILRIGSEEDPEIGAPIVVDIYRYDASLRQPHRIRQYIVPYRRRMSVLTLLREIYDRIDPTLAFRNQQCGRGICGTCRVRVDGKIEKGCEVLIEPGSRLVIKPCRESTVIRDLVVSS
jgi:succinate dehydrogenase/fumarate reductase-like Fe-S protein